MFSAERERARRERRGRSAQQLARPPTSFLPLLPSFALDSPSAALTSTSGFFSSTSSASVDNPPILEANELIPRSTVAGAVGEEGAGEVAETAGGAGVVEGLEGASSIHPSAVVVVEMGEASLGVSAGVDILRRGLEGWWVGEGGEEGRKARAQTPQNEGRGRRFDFLIASLPQIISKAKRHN